MIGKTISHYRIVEKIGEGGMGVVYKAEDTKLKRTVALKFLPSDLTRDNEARERFIQEAQAAAAIDHPNICTVYEINESDGDTYIAMAFVEGQSLKEKMMGGPFVLSEAFSLISQVTEGLRAAHKKGITHRDIKPANIMITNEGTAKILDFGLTLQKDPDYALAYAGLSEVFYGISYWGNVPPHHAYPKVKEFAKKAIKMDKDIGEAHASLGMVYTFYDWNWKEAGRALSTALKLNPSSAIIHLSHSWFLSLTERHEEAIAEAKRAQELDPLSPLIIAHIGLACIWGGQYDKAIQEMKAGMILAPDFYLMHYYIGLAYRGKQMHKDAIVEFERAVDLSGGAPWPALILTTNYFETDQIEKGEALLRSLEKRVKNEYLPALGFAYIYFSRNDLDKTYYWLERAFEERDNFLPWCATIPIEDYQLHNHPRLRPLYQKYGMIK